MARRKIFYLCLRDCQGPGGGTVTPGAITSADMADSPCWVPVKGRVPALDQFRVAAHNLKPVQGGWRVPDPFKMILWREDLHTFAAVGYHACAPAAEAIPVSRTEAQRQYHKRSMSGFFELRHVVRPVVFKAKDPQDLQYLVAVQHDRDLGDHLHAQAQILEMRAAREDVSPLADGPTDLQKEAARAHDGWLEHVKGMHWPRIRIDEARGLLARIREAVRGVRNWMGDLI